jgi:predicted DNA-binding protein (MmcQ/YjbR family)
MNKKHWITISFIDEIVADMLIDLINNSYTLIVSKLTKADKNRLE